MFARRLMRNTFPLASKAPSRGMATRGSNYQVTLNIPTATLKTLRDQGYTLYAFKGVTPTKAMLSTVWFSNDTYMERNVFNWTEVFQGFISDSAVTNGVSINSSTVRNMGAGDLQTVDVNGDGILTTTKNTTSTDPIAASAYSFKNPSNTQFVCGLTHVNPDGSAQPICALPLNPHTNVPIVPIEKVFFMFSTNEHQVGQALTSSTSDGYLLNLTLTPKMEITFDFKTNWTSGNSPNASIQDAQPFFDLWSR